MTISRRRALATLSSAALLPTSAAALAACGASPSGGDASKPVTIRPDVTLQLLIELGAQYQPQFENVLGRWRQSIPGGAPKVEYALGTSAANLEKTQSMLAAGTPPDLLQQEVTGAIGLIAKNQIFALDNVIKRDKLDLSDFFERSYPQFEWKGKKHGISKGMSNQSMYVNQTLFQQAGATLPPVKSNDAGWDFDTFVRTAERLTKRSGSETTQWGFILGRGLRGGFGQFIRANGGEFFDKDFTRCTLNEPRAVEALQFMQDLMYKYRVAPTPREEMAAGGAGPMFIQQGIAGMWINPVSNVPNQRAASYQWDLAVNPKGNGSAGKRVTTGGGQAWLILNASKNHEEAWAFLKHATSVDSMKEMSVNWYPSRKSVLEWLLAQDPQLPPKNRAVGIEGQGTMAYDPVHPAYSDIQAQIIMPELAPLWANEKNAAQVVESMVPKVTAAIKAAAA
ncbi:MAG TPA: sugar ABC transporter substrate-binding protein [Chloroflexota bacterium]|nr:sugar ABC transporter substrate-binding protein [Chloroflexota bacterium]